MKINQLILNGLLSSLCMFSMGSSCSVENEQRRAEQPKAQQEQTAQEQAEQAKTEQPQKAQVQPEQPQAEQPHVEQPHVEQPHVEQLQIEQEPAEQAEEMLSVAVYASAMDKSVDIKPDILASRHPIFAVSAAFALRTLYGSFLGDTDGTRNLVDMADFSLALLAPSVLGVEGVYAGATMVIVSALVKHPNQVGDEASYLHPIFYAAALSHGSNALRDGARPLIDAYWNHTALADYGSATQYLVPAVANAAPVLVYYVVKGNFNGLAGTLTKGTGFKTVYLLCDCLEKLNVVALSKIAGDQVWIEPVAQAGTGVVLSISAYGLNALSQALTKILPDLARKTSKKAIEKATQAAIKKSVLLKYVAVPKVAIAAGLSGTIAGIFGEVAGYEVATAGFTAVQKATPEYAPYINPVLGVALIYALSQHCLHGGLKAQHPAMRDAATGAALAGFLEVFSALFRLPGWIEDARGIAWESFKNSLPAGPFAGTMFGNDEL